MTSYLARFTRQKRALILPVAFFALAFCAFAANPRHSNALQEKAEFMIENKSDWDIHHLFLSPADDDQWGPDQLGDHVLKSGTSFTLRSIPCDTYDIKVVDDDGDACIIKAIPMCKDHTHWDITNKELAKCQGWGG